MPVSNQEYDSRWPFVWYVLFFDFAIWLGTFRFEFSSEFSIFVVLLFTLFISDDSICSTDGNRNIMLFIDYWYVVKGYRKDKVSCLTLKHPKIKYHQTLYICVQPRQLRIHYFLIPPRKLDNNHFILVVFPWLIYSFKFRTFFIFCLYSLTICLQWFSLTKNIIFFTRALSI